jgi:cytochrome b involved in lipid metabolism
MKLVKIMLVFALVLLTACTTSSQSGQFTATEVARHNQETDCWMIVNNKVYDVTAYVSGHPGGDDILRGCGKDATTLFATQGGGGVGRHSAVAESLLKSFYIGELTK